MKSIFTLFLVSVTLFSNAQNRCGTEAITKQMMENNPEYAIAKAKVNAQTNKWIKNHHNDSEKTIITIPVVVHVVWNTTTENISNAQIFSQITVLNEDFRKDNTTAVNTPNVWQGIAADCEIEFCLAQTDPNGNNTTGITRTQTNEMAFSMNDDVKSTSNGGIDAWDNNNYLNIWVCNLIDASGAIGYATYPSSVTSRPIS